MDYITTAELVFELDDSELCNAMPEDLPDAQTILDSVELDNDFPLVRSGALYLSEITLTGWRFESDAGRGRLSARIVIECEFNPAFSRDGKTPDDFADGHLLFSDITPEDGGAWELDWNLSRFDTVRVG